MQIRITFSIVLLSFLRLAFLIALESTRKSIEESAISTMILLFKSSFSFSESFLLSFFIISGDKIRRESSEGTGIKSTGIGLRPRLYRR